MIASAAVAVAVVLAGGIIPIAPLDFRAATAITGGIGVVLTAVAVLGWRRALAWALVAFVLEYAIALADRPALDLRAPIVGAGLLMVGELASLAQSFDGPSSAQRRTSAQVVETLGSGLGAVVMGALVTATAADRPRAGLLLQIASAAAAVGLLVLMVLLTKRPPEGS